MSCNNLFKKVHIYLGTIGGRILNVQCPRASEFLVIYPTLFESVFAEIA
jgi:hypothetical protein